MDYYLLLEVAVDLGYALAMAGAETYRVEDTVHRILSAYGLESEIFAIPNCLIVSIETPAGKPMTRMRRMGQHGNDLDAVLGGVNLLAMGSNGQRVIANFLTALEPILAQGVRQCAAAEAKTLQ